MLTTASTDLKTLQGQLRQTILGLYNRANAGHIGCSLSCIDLMIATLILRKRPQDTFLLSKGHAAAALYASLHHLGELSDSDLETYYQNGTTLPAHPAPNQHAGIPFATGSLGHGLPIGTGIAHADKLLGSDAYTYVLMSDGETNEGTTWEAAHFAVQHQLDTLLVMVDKNGLQGFDTTDKVLGDTANADVWADLGFEVAEADGHDVGVLLETVDKLLQSKNGKPKLIIAHTVKGKGVSYMENRLEWHYLPMTPQQFDDARQQIDQQYLSA